MHLLVPQEFYDPCTNFADLYRCSICEAGSYISIFDTILGGYTCQDAEMTADAGLVSIDQCPLLTSLVADNCGCLVPETPANDKCSGAIPLSIDSGELIAGPTKGATPKIDGCIFFGRLQGVWYSLMGAGIDTVVSLCEGTSFNTAIIIFEGPGDNLL
jgi:hypothetical protein